MKVASQAVAKQSERDVSWGSHTRAVDFIAGQLQLARHRHHSAEKLAGHVVLHLRLAERSRWLNERPKKNRYSQTKIDVPQPHWRWGLAAQDDQLLTQDNVFTFSPVTPVGLRDEQEPGQEREHRAFDKRNYRTTSPGGGFR
jgi:hypothetical protein